MTQTNESGTFFLITDLICSEPGDLHHSFGDHTLKMDGGFGICLVEIRIEKKTLQPEKFM